ncbi:MAG: hypothetical protein ABEK50_11295, partial [bacterium]
VGLLRWYVYGSPLPHSVTAKSGPLLQSFFDGLVYLRFGLVNHLGLLTVLGGVVGLYWLTDRYLQLRALAVVLLQVTVVCLAGGDWMPYSRLLLPVLPVLVLGWYGLSQISYRRTVLATMVVLSLFHAGFYPTVNGYTRHLSRSVQDNIAAMKSIKKDLPRDLPERMALTDLGAFGWAARDWYVIDRVGLVTPAIGNQGGGLYRNYSPEYVLEQEPTLIQTHLSPDAPTKPVDSGGPIEWREITVAGDDFIDHAQWKGGEALYSNQRFLKNYKVYRVFHTPGNPMNIFWIREGLQE